MMMTLCKRRRKIAANNRSSKKWTAYVAVNAWCHGLTLLREEVALSSLLNCQKISCNFAHKIWQVLLSRQLSPLFWSKLTKSQKFSESAQAGQGYLVLRIISQWKIKKKWQNAVRAVPTTQDQCLSKERGRGWELMTIIFSEFFSRIGKWQLASDMAT